MRIVRAYDKSWSTESEINIITLQRIALKHDWGSG